MNYQVMAVIGDGAITGGMAFEALNHAGQLGTKLIVVLNDNGMSISPTVGALSRLIKQSTIRPSIPSGRESGQEIFWLSSRWARSYGM